MSLAAWCWLACRELADSLSFAVSSAWRWRVRLGFCAVAVGVAVWLLLPEDRDWLSSVRTASCEHHVLLRDSAEWLSWLGNFWSFNAPLAIALVWLGWWRSAPRLRRLAVISLAGAALAGSVALVGRGLSGRPRPTAQRADGFYGPHQSSQMQAFPSGHAASAFGCALPLLLNAPALGVPVTVVASGIAWSRLYLGRHHPTDVLVSLLIAGLSAAALTRWHRRHGDHSPTTETTT